VTYWGENPLLFLFSSMDFYWIVVPMLWAALGTKAFARYVFAIAFSISIALGGSVWDPTRVFALLFWSLLVYVVTVLSKDELDKIFKKIFLPALLLVALVFPGISFKDGGSMVFVGSKTYKSYQVCP
jgi:hypothetical protein